MIVKYSLTALVYLLYCLFFRTDISAFDEPYFGILLFFLGSVFLFSGQYRRLNVFYLIRFRSRLRALSGFFFNILFQLVCYTTAVTLVFALRDGFNDYPFTLRFLPFFLFHLVGAILLHAAMLLARVYAGQILSICLGIVLPLAAFIVSVNFPEQNIWSPLAFGCIGLQSWTQPVLDVSIALCLFAAALALKKRDLRHV